MALAFRLKKGFAFWELDWISCVSSDRVSPGGMKSSEHRRLRFGRFWESLDQKEGCALVRLFGQLSFQEICFFNLAIRNNESL